MNESLQSEVAELRRVVSHMGEAIGEKLSVITQTQADLRVQIAETKADMRGMLAETKSAIAEKNSGTSARVAMLWGTGAALATAAIAYLVSRVLSQ